MHHPRVSVTCQPAVRIFQVTQLRQHLRQAPHENICTPDKVSLVPNNREHLLAFANHSICAFETCIDPRMVCMWQQCAAVVISMAALAARLVDCASKFTRRRLAAMLHDLSMRPFSCAGTYTVQSGDTCYNIAMANGLTLAQFESFNSGVDCDSLQIGSTVNLSGSSSTPSSSPPESSAASPESSSQSGATQSRLCLHCIQRCISDADAALMLIIGHH